MRYGVAVALLCGLAGCGAISAGQMRLSPALDSGQSVEMIGVTGWQGGRYSLGSYAGTYKRTGSKATFLDRFTNFRGHNRFTIAGPEISDVISADCWMDQGELGNATLSAITRPLVYHCDFLADGRAFPSRFDLRDSESRVINRYARDGEIALGGEIVQFRSVHQLAGARIPTSTPIGYAFEQRGVPIGAIELNGRPRFITAPGIDPGVRRTMAVASVALALLDDPE